MLWYQKNEMLEELFLVVDIFLSTGGEGVWNLTQDHTSSTRSEPLLQI